MKISILYDSFFGNTEHIAKAVAKGFKNENNEVLLLNIIEADWNKVCDCQVVIVGSPTRGFRPSPFTTKFLKGIPSNGLKNVKVAAFDTRMSLPDIESKALRFIVKTGGYAAKAIAGFLQKKGGELVAAPEGFIVKGDKGPLLSGELERAEKWATQIIS